MDYTVGRSNHKHTLIGIDVLDDAVASHAPDMTRTAQVPILQGRPGSGHEQLDSGMQMLNEFDATHDAVSKVLSINLLNRSASWSHVHDANGVVPRGRGHQVAILDQSPRQMDDASELINLGLKRILPSTRRNSKCDYETGDAISL